MKDGGITSSLMRAVSMVTPGDSVCNLMVLPEYLPMNAFWNAFLSSSYFLSVFPVFLYRLKKVVVNKDHVFKKKLRQKTSKTSVAVCLSK